MSFLIYVNYYAKNSLHAFLFLLLQTSCKIKFCCITTILILKEFYKFRGRTLTRVDKAKKIIEIIKALTKKVHSLFAHSFLSVYAEQYKICM